MQARVEFIDACAPVENLHVCVLHVCVWIETYMRYQSY